MATRKPKPEAEPLPPLAELPETPFEHPTLHRIINEYVGGTSMTKLAAKHSVSLGYVKGVIHEYLTKYD